MRLAAPNRRVFVTQGFMGGDFRWVSQCVPRPEDCLTGEDFPYLATEALHVVLFIGSGALGTYDPETVLDSDDGLLLADSYDKFPTKGDPAVPSYRVVCYIDQGNAEENDTLSGTTDFTDAINDLEIEVSGVCDSLSDFGFEYSGRFDYRVPGDIEGIAQVIKTHWGIS